MTGARKPIEELIEAGSLGTPGAKAMRATVSDEQAAAIVARSKELAELDREFPEPPTSPTGIKRPSPVAVHVATARPGDVLVIRHWLGHRPLARRSSAAQA